MLKNLRALRQCVNRLADDLGVPEAGPPGTCLWSPYADVYESEIAFVIDVEIPGVAPEGMEISVHDNLLTLRGERSVLRAGKHEEYHRMERMHGEFRRVFALPFLPAPESVQASYTNGVLTITVPKEAIGGKQIPVS